jgi:hypothetical protein
MKKAKKALSLILAILMVMSIIPITASAATYSGTCGSSLTWTYNQSTKTLTISGTGLMDRYKKSNRPWESPKAPKYSSVYSLTKPPFGAIIIHA